MDIGHRASGIGVRSIPYPLSPIPYPLLFARSHPRTLARLCVLVCAVLIVAGLWWWHGRMSWEIANTPPQNDNIVCFGDSLTRGAGVQPGEAYPAVLAEMLGLPAWRVLSRGVDGRTIIEAKGDVDRDVFSTHAGTVVILLGGNDQLRGLPVEESMAALEQIIDAVQEHGLLVVLCDFSPFPLLQGDWSRGYRDLARRFGCVLVPGVADGLYGDRQTQASDVIHLTAAGQRVMAERIARAMAPYLGIDVGAVERRIAASEARAGS
jgi:acyl-CoA thioesterase-1